MIENFHNQLHYNPKHDLWLKIVIISAKGCQQYQTGTGFILCNIYKGAAILQEPEKWKLHLLQLTIWALDLQSDSTGVSSSTHSSVLALLHRNRRNAPPPHLPAPLSGGTPAARVATTALQPYSIRFEVYPPAAAHWPSNTARDRWRPCHLIAPSPLLPPPQGLPYSMQLSL